MKGIFHFHSGHLVDHEQMRSVGDFLWLGHKFELPAVLNSWLVSGKAVKNAYQLSQKILFQHK